MKVRIFIVHGVASLFTFDSVANKFVPTVYYVLKQQECDSTLLEWLTSIYIICVRR